MTWSYRKSSFITREHKLRFSVSNDLYFFFWNVVGIYQILADNNIHKILSLFFHSGDGLFVEFGIVGCGVCWVFFFMFFLWLGVFRLEEQSHIFR